VDEVYLYANISEITETELVIRVPRPPKSIDFIAAAEVEVKVADGREISPKQRKKTYALLSDISEHIGEVLQRTKVLLKEMFIIETGADWFSLSDCDVTTARKFLQFIIEFCIEQGIPTTYSLLEDVPDIQAYVYACLVNKVCCICQKPGAEFHHCKCVGMGRNRKEICHLGEQGLPLCRIHHDEVHRKGQQTFEGYHHVCGVEADENIVRVYKL
jgi:hypothetical protein